MRKYNYNEICHQNINHNPIEEKKNFKSYFNSYLIFIYRGGGTFTYRKLAFSQTQSYL